jgi:transposase
VAELRALDRKIAPVDADIAWMLDEHGTTLTDIVGIGRTGAATILAITGDPARFRSAAAFASFAGTAPIAASSGDTIRHRLNRGGNRQLNKVLHTAAKTQIRLAAPGRDYYQRRRAEGKTNTEAIRALKRHITTAIYRTLQADAAARAARWRRRRTSEAEQPGRADRQPPRVTGHSSDHDNLLHALNPNAVAAPGQARVPTDRPARLPLA